jgi:Copper chaperone
MKKIGLFLLGLFLCLSTVVNLQAQDNNQKKKTEEVVFLTNIHCDNCKKKIEKNISWEKGVKDLRVDLDDKKITILYDPAKNNQEKLQAAVVKLGYTCEVANSD